MELKLDFGPSRPDCGDIWIEKQRQDVTLDAVLDRYDRRSAV
jgi:hypothetical protein